MNTYDIRNMGTSQWIFWAAAIPVTIIVVGLAVVAVLKIDAARGLWAKIVERDGSRRVEEEEADYHRRVEKEEEYLRRVRREEYRRRIEEEEEYERRVEDY